MPLLQGGWQGRIQGLHRQQPLRSPLQRARRPTGPWSPPTKGEESGKRAPSPPSPRIKCSGPQSRERIKMTSREDQLDNGETLEDGILSCRIGTATAKCKNNDAQASF